VSADARPFVSIIVPVLNGGPPFRELLNALAALTWPAERREILIVDNGSTDDTAAVAARTGHTVITEPEPGAARARNAGVARARGRILAFTDADCLVTRRWLDELVAPFADPAVGGVGGRTETYRPVTPAERHAARIQHLDAERHLAHPTFPFAPTANAAFRREVFDAIGGFDPAFPWGEPIDFCKRLVRDTGFRLAYAPRAVVFHRARASTADFCRQQWGYGYSQALLCAKYGDEVRWGPRQEWGARWGVWRAGLDLPLALLRRARRADALEASWLEFKRQMARRRGFTAAVRERGLKLS